jgi:hypothetical protein
LVHAEVLEDEAKSKLPVEVKDCTRLLGSRALPMLRAFKGE